VGRCSFSGCNLPLFYCFLLTYIPYLWPISSTQCFYRPVRPEWPEHGSYTGPCGRCVVYTDLRSDSVIFLRSSWAQYPHFRAIPEISIRQYRSLSTGPNKLAQVRLRHQITRNTIQLTQTITDYAAIIRHIILHL